MIFFSCQNYRDFFPAKIGIPLPYLKLKPRHLSKIIHILSALLPPSFPLLFYLNKIAATQNMLPFSPLFQKADLCGYNHPEF